MENSTCPRLASKRALSMTSNDLSVALRSASEDSGSSVIEGQTRTRIIDALARVKTSALLEIRSLGLQESTSRDLFHCLQRAIEKEESRYEIKPPVTDPNVLFALRFNHTCRALGCSQSMCDLCESNPKRRCLSHFDKKYFKGDAIKAKCGGAIYVELVDYETGEVVPSSQYPPNAMMELCVVDGNKFEQIFPRGKVTAQSMHHLDSCILVFGNESRPLLQSEDRSHFRENGKLLASLQVEIPQNGWKTRKGSRLSQKKAIPFADDPVSRLENMGKERIKKLSNLEAAAAEMNVSFENYNPSRVVTVADFKKLAFFADTNGQLKQKLLHMLKMSEKAWEETRDHAANAITNDTRMRTWHHPDITDLQGLAYVCYMGEIDLQRPVALLLDDTIVLRECLDVHQRDLMKELETMAIDCWWKPNHPGWSFLSFDSEVFNKDHASLLSMGPLRSEHHSRSRPVSKQLEENLKDTESDQRIVTPGPKRAKKNDHSKLSSPISPSTPEDARSQNEGDALPLSIESIASRPCLPSAAGQKEMALSRVPYSGAVIEPVIPMMPPDSAFTRKPRMQANGCAKRDRSEIRLRPLPDPALIEQFYVTTSQIRSRGVSNSGAGDVYTPLKTPFDSTAIEALVKKQLAQPLRPFKTDSSEDGHGSNAIPAKMSSTESLLSANKRQHSEDFSQPPSERYSCRPSNHLSCSIESLSSQCKEAIMDEQRIRQMDKNGGYSNQDFQHSFEGCVLGQMKKRTSQSSQLNEALHAIPVETANAQLQVTENSTQLNGVPDGVYSYNIVLVPYSDDRMQDSTHPANI